MENIPEIPSKFPLYPPRQFLSSPPRTAHIEVCIAPAIHSKAFHDRQRRNRHLLNQRMRPELWEYAYCDNVPSDATLAIERCRHCSSLFRQAEEPSCQS